MLFYPVDQWPGWATLEADVSPVRLWRVILWQAIQPHRVESDSATGAYRERAYKGPLRGEGFAPAGIENEFQLQIKFILM